MEKFLDVVEEKKRETGQLERESGTVEETALTAALIEEHKSQKLIAVDSAEHKHALEEHSMKNWNGNTNARYFLLATIHAVTTEENF